MERSVSSKEKIRESTSKKYRNFHIPWEWMMDTGLIGQVKTIYMTCNTGTHFARKQILCPLVADEAKFIEACKGIHEKGN